MRTPGDDLLLLLGWDPIGVSLQRALGLDLVNSSNSAEPRISLCPAKLAAERRGPRHGATRNQPKSAVLSNAVEEMISQRGKLTIA